MSAAVVFLAAALACLLSSLSSSVLLLPKSTPPAGVDTIKPKPKPGASAQTKPGASAQTKPQSKPGASAQTKPKLEPPAHPCVDPAFKPCTDAAFTDMLDGGVAKYPAFFNGKCCRYGNSLNDPAKDAANRKVGIAMLAATVVVDLVASFVPGRIGTWLNFTSDTLGTYGLTTASAGGGVSVKCGGSTPDYKKNGKKNYVYSEQVKGADVYYTADDGCPIVALDPVSVAYIADIGRGATGMQNFQYNFATKGEDYDATQPLNCFSAWSTVQGCRGSDCGGGVKTCYRQATLPANLPRQPAPGYSGLTPGSTWW